MFVSGCITNSHVPSLPLNDPGISQRKPPGIPPGSGNGFPEAMISSIVNGDFMYGRDNLPALGPLLTNSVKCFAAVLE